VVDGQSTKHILSKFDGIGFSHHGYPGLKEPFSNERVAIETHGQRGNGVEHPSKNVMLLKEASVLFKELLRNRAQQHGF
jgi:hypothetical protein